MPPKSKPQVVSAQAELVSAFRRLADLVEILATSVDNLTTEIQWQNNERSADCRLQHLPLTRLPLNPATEAWHPVFGTGERSPVPRESVASSKRGQSTLFC
jgi:hypothetical protein